VESCLDLTNLFRFFGENQDLLRDRAVIPGQELESDFEVVLEFTNLTGNEEFLNGQWLGETLEISFYVDHYLAQSSLDLSNEARRDYIRAINPSAFNEENIYLTEIEWDFLMENYEAEIFSITLDGPPIDGIYFNRAFFESSEFDLSHILEFLYENQHNISNTENDEYGRRGSIHFIRKSEDEPRINSRFYMNEQQMGELMDIIGEDEWERGKPNR